MPINRFYTSALPQYTSQFVQDQKPWDKLFAYEQQKLARTDAAQQGAAKAQSQFTSLQPGYRTGDISQQVIEEYEGQLADWQKKYSGSMYSIPAMRELTAIQGRFQADPNVKMVQQDFAANQLYDRMRASKDYRIETDPNIDPETGLPRPFVAGQQFTPYDQPVYYGDISKELDPILASISSRKDPINDIRYIKDEQGNKIPVKFSGTKEVLDETDFAKTRPELVEKIYRGEGEGSRYLKALYGDQWTPEFVDQLVREREAMRYIDRETGSTTFLPGYTTKTPDEDETKTVYEFDATAQKQVPPDNSGGPGEALIGRSREIGAGFRKWKMGIFKGANGEKYYQNVKNDPSAIVGGKTIDPETGETLSRSSTIGVTNKDIVTRAMYEQPYSTIANFESFWNEVLSDPNLTPEGKRRLEKKKKTYDGYIEKAKEQYGVGGPSYTNDIELNKALSSATEAANAGSEYAYSGPEITDINNLTPEQAVGLRITNEKYTNEIMDRGYIPGFIGFSEDIQKEFTSRFGGLPIDSNGVVKTDGGLPEQLAGAVIINPDDPNDFVKVEDKKGFYKKGDALYVSGMFENTQSQYGPGVFSMVSGDKTYLVRGAKEFVEPYEFTNVIHTHEMPKNNDEGDYFAYRGRNSRGNHDVLYRWNENVKETDAADVWMNVSLDRVSHPDEPHYVVRAFQMDPNKADDDSYLRAYDEENNPNGYFNYPITDATGYGFNKAELPPDIEVERTVMKAWIESLVDAGQMSEDQGLEVYRRAFQ